MPTSAQIVGQQNLNHFALELTYSGLEVPETLLADLAALGWQVPSTPPRPASAIDWSTPDPDAGTAYTIRDWVVEDVPLGPPAGSGIGGRWTDDERAAHLKSTRDVLRRHEVTISEDGVEPEVVAEPVAPLPAAAPATVESSAGGVRLMSVLAPDRGQVLHGLLDSLGVRGRIHAAIVAATVGVGARAGSPARPRVTWIEAELEPEMLETAAGSMLLSSPLFRHALWLRHVDPGTPEPVDHPDAMVLQAIVPTASMHQVIDAVATVASASVSSFGLQSNGRTADVVIEGPVERLLFDAVCAEIVRVSGDAVCRGDAA